MSESAPVTYICHCCEKEALSPGQEDGLDLLPEGWGFVLDDDPWAERSIRIGASAFYACEECKDRD